MNLKITKEIKLTDVEVRDIIIKYLHDHHGLSGIFDIDFFYNQQNSYEIKFNGAKVRISENE